MGRKGAFDYKYPKLVTAMYINGDTFEKLAKILDMSRATIMTRFKGDTDWTIGEIDKLCIYFGKDYYDLFK